MRDALGISALLFALAAVAYAAHWYWVELRPRVGALLAGLTSRRRSRASSAPGGASGDGRGREGPPMPPHPAPSPSARDLGRIDRAMKKRARRGLRYPTPTQRAAFSLWRRAVEWRGVADAASDGYQWLPDSRVQRVAASFAAVPVCIDDRMNGPQAAVVCVTIVCALVFFAWLALVVKDS